MENKHYKVVILGSGPAGLTAAIYSARADLKPLVIDGPVPGGQLTITTEVENFPGFPDGVSGPEMMNLFRAQAEKFGTDFTQMEVREVFLDRRPFVLKGIDREVTADTLIISTGATARWMGLESEEKLRGRGVSACATCDGFFFRDKEIVVVGGGDTALEEATFLTKFASKVIVVHRRDELRASKYMQNLAKKNEKIEFIWDSVILDILGTDETGVTGIQLKNVKTGKISEVECQGVFMAIGHVPNTGLFKSKLEMDETGYLVTHDGTKTSVPGVFAAGDVQDKKYRQAITAAGTGCMAAIDSQHFLQQE